MTRNGARNPGIRWSRISASGPRATGVTVEGAWGGTPTGRWSSGGGGPRSPTPHAPRAPPPRAPGPPRWGRGRGRGPGPFQGVDHPEAMRGPRGQVRSRERLGRLGTDFLYLAVESNKNAYTFYAHSDAIYSFEKDVEDGSWGGAPGRGGVPPGPRSQAAWMTWRTTGVAPYHWRDASPRGRVMRSISRGRRTRPRGGGLVW